MADDENRRIDGRTLDDDIDLACNDVNRAFRKASKKGNTAVNYTQETHEALKLTAAVSLASLRRAHGRISELEARLAEVEKKGLAYRGVWQRACDYDRGDIVTRSGVAWAATVKCKAGEVPGEGNNGWQLMLKSAQ